MANDTTYKIEGHDGAAYTVFEYRGPTSVYVYRGFIRGNVMHLYPKHSLCRGERRSKITVSLREVRQ